MRGRTPAGGLHLQSATSLALSPEVTGVRDALLLVAGCT